MNSLTSYNIIITWKDGVRGFVPASSKDTAKALKRLWESTSDKELERGVGIKNIKIKKGSKGGLK